MYYDSQSGKYVSVPGQRGVVIHDVTFETEKHFEYKMKSEMMEILESQFQLSPKKPEQNDGIQSPVAGGAWTGVGGG